MSAENEDKNNIEDFDPDKISDILGPKKSHEDFDFELNEEEEVYTETSEHKENDSSENDFYEDENKGGFFSSIKDKVADARAAAKEEKEESTSQEKTGFFSSIKEKVADAKEADKEEKEESTSQEKTGFFSSIKEKVVDAKEAEREEKEESTSQEKTGFFSSIKEKVAETKEAEREESEENYPRFIGSIKKKVALARQSKKDMLEKDAGLDFDIAPQASFSSVAEEKSLFEQTLTPLSTAEITILQSEIAADETLFRKVELGKSASLARQQIGFMIGLTMAFFFYLAQGINYFTSTLINAEAPSWTPKILEGEPMAAMLFAVGAVLPVLMIFVIATGFRQLVSGLVDVKIEKMIWGIISMVLALASFSALWRGDVVSAFVLSGAYLVILIIARIFRI